MIFKIIRKYTKVFFWVMAIGIIPSFILWNIAANTTGQKKQVVGELFGKKIYVDEFLKEKQIVEQQAWLKYGDKVEQYINLDQETWVRLMLLHKAKEQKIQVQEKEVFEEIKNLPAFKQYGSIDPRTYRAILANALRTTVGEFEAGMKNTVMVRKLVDTIMAEVDISEQELKETYYQENEQAKASFISFTTESYKKDTTITEEEISEYFNKNKERLKTPLKRNVEFVEFKLADFKNQPTVTEEAIEQYYNEHKESFKAQSQEDPERYLSFEQAHDLVKQILEQDIQDTLAKEKAEQFQEEAEDKGFTQAAKDNNLAVIQTGYFGQNEEVPNVGLSYDFIRGAFSLNPEEISPLIKAKNSYFILRLLGEESPRQKTEQEAGTEIIETLTQEKGDVLCRVAAEQAYEKIKSIISYPVKTFKDSANELNFPLQTTELFTRRGYIKTLGMAPDFSKAAFDLKVGEISSLVKTPRGYSILTPDEFYPVNEDDYNKNKDQYKKRQLFAKQSTHLNNWFQELEKEANLKNYLELIKQLQEKSDDQETEVKNE
ncbi:MAG: peptidyl-prolyl cis-trans isomerase [Candidatus Omnitrophota bacterium]